MDIHSLPENPIWTSFFIWGISDSEQDTFYAPCHTLIILSSFFCGLDSLDCHSFCIVGEVRKNLKWGDSKAIKNEIDMQVGSHTLMVLGIFLILKSKIWSL